MIVDSSAVIAFLGAEPWAERIAHEFASQPVQRIGAPTVLEVSMVVDSRPRLDAIEPWAELLSSFEIVEFTEQDAVVARQAHRRYGPGSGSPARLNYADCMSYAIAKRLGEPLLFVGNDFAETDIDSVL